MSSKSVQKLLKEKKVYQVPKGKPVFASPDISVQEAIEIMQAQHHGYIVLVNQESEVKGIFTETDVSRKILDEKVDWKEPVSKFMTADPIVLKPKDTVSKAITLMGKHRVYHLPVVDENNKLDKVLSVRALIRFLAEFYPKEIYNLPPDPDKIIETAEGG